MASFGQPNPENQLPVGQNRHFCPSEAEKTALRWATRATAGREEGLPQSPPQRPRCSRRIAFTPAAVPCLPLIPSVPFSLPSPCLLPAFSLLTPAFSLPSHHIPTAFAPPIPQNSPCVPQKQPFWCPKLAKTAWRTPKATLLGSQARKNRLAYPKNSLFGVPSPQNSPLVPQIHPFWCPRVPLGKTGVFAHLRQEKRLFVGQNRRFCPSTAGKTAPRWAKQAFLPIHDRENRVPLGKIRVFAHRSSGDDRRRETARNVRRR